MTNETNNHGNADRRRFTRIRFDSEIQLFSGSGVWNCQLVDISLKGAMFTRPQAWSGKQGDVFRVSISLNNSPSISMNIEIAHVDTEAIGAKWTKIDVGSFSSLKRLLELNIEEKNRISKEISFL